MLQMDPVVPPKKKKTTTKKKTKTGTLRIRRSRAIPSKVASRYGTRRELLRYLVNHELGWCTDDNLLYIKIGKALKPIGQGGGSGADFEIRGISDQVVVTKDSTSGKDIYTIALANEVIQAQVPPPPATGAAGKVLTANEDGTFTWQDPIVDSVDEIEL